MNGSKKRYLFKLALTCCFLVGEFSLVFADNELHVRDFEAVTQYLHTKRTIDLFEKKDFLKISGDVRWTWLNRTETQDGDIVRGSGKLLPHDTFEAILNLRFDYKCGERTWAAGYLTYDNNAGIDCPGQSCAIDPQQASGSGACDDICLKRAFWGIRAYDCEGVRLDIEVGRRPMYTIFDSRIEFHARFDGILFRLSDAVKGWGNYYINGGPFVIDYRVNHFGYVFELGVFDFYDVGFDIKYSLIDWEKRGKNKCFVRDSLGNKYLVSQWSLAYNVSEKVIPRKMKIYSAFLVNHAARGVERTNYMRKNLGWYVGFIVGEVKKKNDWSLDFNYQVVQALAISDCDIHGIGRGNARRETFARTGRNKVNYNGWHIEGLYAINDKLSLDVLSEFSREEDRRIGGKHTFIKTEVDLILAF